MNNYFQVIVIIIGDKMAKVDQEALKVLKRSSKIKHWNLYILEHAMGSDALQRLMKKYGEKQVRTLVGDPYNGNSATSMSIVDVGEVPTANGSGDRFYAMRGYFDKRNDKRDAKLIGYDFAFIEQNPEGTPQLHVISPSNKDLKVNLTLTDLAQGAALEGLTPECISKKVDKAWGVQKTYRA